MKLFEDTDTLAAENPVLTKASFSELRERILSVLKRHHGSMGARDLIREVQSGPTSDSEDVRRVMLELSAGGLTEYTSNWDVVLKNPSAYE